MVQFLMLNLRGISSRLYILCRSNSPVFCFPWLSASHARSGDSPVFCFPWLSASRARSGGLIANLLRLISSRGTAWDQFSGIRVALEWHHLLQFDCTNPLRIILVLLATKTNARPELRHPKPQLTPKTCRPYSVTSWAAGRTSILSVPEHSSQRRRKGPSRGYILYQSVPGRC